MAGCWICNPKGHQGRGAPGDECWAAATLIEGRNLKAIRTVQGRAGAPYEPGLLALREAPWLEAAVRLLPELPEILIVNATGRDHPRRAGMALHLGARLALPTIGVTRQPLIAEGGWPPEERGARSPLCIDGETVACWLRTIGGAAPIVVHPGWRTDIDTAIAVVMAAVGAFRIPEPLRLARRAAREFRARSSSR